MPGITYQVGALARGSLLPRGGAPGLPGVFMGQNNDVAWTFTNVMADVMDLFIERIDGDTYEFEGEWRPLELIEEEIAVKGRSEPERLVVRETHHGPIVNEALRADDAEPLALRFMALDFRASDAGQSRGARVQRAAPSWWRCSASTPTPVSNLVWADRHGSIGYKTVGRIPIRRGGCPDLPKPGWTGEHEWDGWIPYDEMPELTDPDAGFVVTANNRIAPEDYPHHITSDYLDGYRARRIEQLIDGSAGARSGELRSDADGHALAPGSGDGPPAGPAAPARPAGAGRDRAAAQLGRADEPGLDRGHHLPGVHLAAGARGRPGGDRDRDLAERWLDRADNGFIAHVTSPWRWQSHLLASGKRVTRS